MAASSGDISDRLSVLQRALTDLDSAAADDHDRCCDAARRALVVFKSWPDGVELPAATASATIAALAARASGHARAEHGEVLMEALFLVCDRVVLDGVKDVLKSHSELLSGLVASYLRPLEEAEDAASLARLPPTVLKAAGHDLGVSGWLFKEAKTHGGQAAVWRAAARVLHFPEVLSDTIGGDEADWLMSAAVIALNMLWFKRRRGDSVLRTHAGAALKALLASGLAARSAASTPSDTWWEALRGGGERRLSRVLPCCRVARRLCRAARRHALAEHAVRRPQPRPRRLWHRRAAGVCCVVLRCVRSCVWWGCIFFVSRSAPQTYLNSAQTHVHPLY